MVWISYGIGLVSIFFLLLGAILVIGKQIRTSSLSAYYFLIMILCIMGWIISNIFIVYLSQRTRAADALFASRFATIISMVGMIATVLFALTLSPRQKFNPIILSIAIFLFGGVVGLTVSGDYTVTLLPVVGGNYVFYLAQTSITWVIFDTGLALFAGIVFLVYLIKQRGFVEAKHQRVIEIMMLGVILAYFGSAILFATTRIIYSITGELMLLHMEWGSVAVGALVICISIYLGSIEAFYYSTEVYSIDIFDKTGLSIYSASAKKKLKARSHTILSVTTAFSEFTGELVGKEVYPKEIDLGDSSLMIEIKDELVCFVCSRIPTTYLRQAIKHLLDDLTPNISEEEISTLVEKYLAFKPILSKQVE
jgi:hypothetical protein